MCESDRAESRVTVRRDARDFAVDDDDVDDAEYGDTIA